MLLVEYIKTKDGGIIILTAKEINDTEAVAGNIDRFNAFFANVPLWGGKEWKTLEVDQIVLFFSEVAVDIRNKYQRDYDIQMNEHLASSPILRWFKESRGWKPPCVPSQKEIIQYIVNRCRYLSGWMKENSTRKLYIDSDMSYLIQKPNEVADILAKSL